MNWKFHLQNLALLLAAILIRWKFETWHGFWLLALWIGPKDQE